MHSRFTQFLAALCEHHELLPDNSAYIHKLKEILISREQLNFDTCHLLIESAVPLMKFGRKPEEIDLLIDLKPLLDQLGLQKTNINTIEVRRLAIAALALLNPSKILPILP